MRYLLFIHEDLVEQVYIEIFPVLNYIRGRNMMYRIRKILYKLKQSPHA